MERFRHDDSERDGAQRIADRHQQQAEEFFIHHEEIRVKECRKALR
jgi:hypothetical protein